MRTYKVWISFTTVARVLLYNSLLTAQSDILNFFHAYEIITLHMRTQENESTKAFKECYILIHFFIRFHIIILEFCDNLRMNYNIGNENENFN